MLTEEAIKRCKELIKPVHSNWIGLTNQKAIEMILDIIEKYKNSDYETISLENTHLKEELDKTLQENEELKKSKYVYGIDMDFDYIPKQKIRDKIEELKEDKENKYYDKFLEYRDLETTLEILEKLIGEK